jgi:hypothetical protein
MASAFARKRTALYVVEPDRLLKLSDVPSAGDTAYGGVVLREGALWFSYYTSDTTRDYPWLIGMISRSDIRIAKVPLDRLTALAKAKGASEAGPAPRPGPEAARPTRTRRSGTRASRRPRPEPDA